MRAIGQAREFAQVPRAEGSPDYGATENKCGRSSKHRSAMRGQQRRQEQAERKDSVPPIAGVGDPKAIALTTASAASVPTPSINSHLSGDRRSEAEKAQ